MTMTRILRIARWTALGSIVLIAAGTAFVEFGLEANPRSEVPSVAGGAAAGAVAIPAGVAIGGPFDLIDDTGRPVTDADYRGRWMLVYFGYTDCPDDCPLTLQKVAAALRDLGPLAGRIAPLFITVDPARDTPARLASYLENFDSRIVGLTGSSRQIAAAATAYRVYYSPGEHEPSGADLISHSTFLYLMNPNGRLAALFAGDVSAAHLSAALRARLLPPEQAAR